MRHNEQLLCVVAMAAAWQYLSLRACYGRLPGYVEGGGAYLGLCAGAYYACRRVEFELGTRHACTAARPCQG